MSVDRFTYCTLSGEVFERDENGNLVSFGRGYAGFGVHKNDPKSVAIRGQGPIPPGRWIICMPVDDQRHGPVTMRLWPCPATDTLGRSGFMIHGDSRRDPGNASNGCIVLPLEVRQRIARSVVSDPDTVVLTVV